MGKVINLTAVILGVLGTALLFEGSFAYEAPAFYFDDEYQMINAMNYRNMRRQRLQRAGLLCILFSFMLQGVGQFVE